MDVYVGDKVQIVNGGIDVTNGVKATSGRMYGEGGPLWATVELIDTNWNTGGKFGLPTVVTKVRCTNNGTVVWQVRPEDIAPNVIRASQPEEVKSEPEKTEAVPVPTDSGKADLVKSTYVANTVFNKHTPYAPLGDSEVWTDGAGSSSDASGTLKVDTSISVKTVSGNAITNPTAETVVPLGGTWRALNNEEKKSIGNPSGLLVDDSLMKGNRVTKTAWQDSQIRRQMQSEDVENIQNSSGFPYKTASAQGLLTAKYDYQVIPGDPRYQNSARLEDKLRDARAAFGIHVHGSNNIARAVKYYMYNRFKSPDTNLAHNRSVTYVFFTRPDLNILTASGKEIVANSQTMSHTEAAMIWRRYPEVFKLLTDRVRCNDLNNFNFLLSNTVQSFEIKDEQLSTNEAGKSWRDYSVIYGDAYSGREAGSFTCEFADTQDLSVYHLIKLWITYIDNVSRGAWSPSYDLYGGTMNWNSSHVFTKSLDYASSAYVFRCGPDGEEILYWTKYYGIFPANTGVSAFSWNNTTPIGEAPKLNIEFKYSWKADLSPVSLIEFNNAANITDAVTAEASFNPEYNHSSRPFVGVPYVEITLADPTLRAGGVSYSTPRTQLRLKFMKSSDDALDDDLLYRTSLGNRISA